MIFEILYKTLIVAKPFRIRFNQVDGFIRVYDGNRYLAFFRLERHDDTDNWIRYLVSLKSGITYIFDLYFTKIKVDSYDRKIINFA